MRIFLLLLVSLLAVAPTGSVITLQEAAYNTRAEAEGVAKDLPKVWVSEVCVQGRVFFRVYFGRFDSRSLALAGQWDLEDIIAELPVGRIASAAVIVKYEA
ncbi:MAG: hypothetical protein ACI9W4_000628 [Rhodothermales bacterium]|jgi:hypothetical protein